MRRRWLVVAIAVLVGAVVVAGRLARGGFIYVSPIAPGEAVAQMEALQRKVGGPLRVVGVDLDLRGTTVELQNAARPEVADRWEVSHFRARRGLIDWIHVSGPSPVQGSQMRLPIKDLVFGAEEVDFAAVAPLAEAAVGRVALEEPAKATGMHLARATILLPYAHAGRLGWTVDVHSPHESARAFANAAGRITELNLDGTLRAQRLNLYDGGQPLLDIARQFSDAFDGKERIHRMLVYRDSLLAKMVDPRDPGGVATYEGSLNGVFRSRIDDMEVHLPAGLGPAPDPAFAVSEVDWSALPWLVGTTRERLDMPDSKVSLVEIRKRARGLGSPAIEWDIDLTAASGPSGSLVLDTTGRVLDARWPSGREPRRNMLDPAAVAQFVAMLRREVAPRTAVMEIVLRPDEDLVSFRDPHDSRRIMQLKYTGHVLETGFIPPSPPGTWMGEHFDDDSFVALEAIDDAVVAALPGRQSAALDRLHIPGGRVEAVSLGRQPVILEGNRQVVVEVDIKGDDGANGRVYFDPRGRVLRTD